MKHIKQFLSSCAVMMGCGLSFVGCGAVDETAPGTDGSPGIGAGAEPTEPVVRNEKGELAVPVAQVARDGATVGFYNVGGQILVQETGRNGSTPLISRELRERQLSAVELYKELAHADAPAELVALDSDGMTRVPTSTAGAEAVSAPSTLPSASGSSGTGKIEQQLLYYDCTSPNPSYDQWFNCTFCYKTFSGWSNEFDFTWMWVTGDGNWKRTVKSAYSTVSVYGGGSIHFRNSSDGSTFLDTFVPNGYWSRADWYLTNRIAWFADWNARSYVDQASGDSYHWCSLGHR
ncbi:MAG: hypothetical protein SFV15_01575 [Polyangiaceae bacterium]|nr:hypothetical protein [Polyangiaceae bacterium]